MSRNKEDKCELWEQKVSIQFKTNIFHRLLVFALFRQIFDAIEFGFYALMLLFFSIKIYRENVMCRHDAVCKI